MSKSVNLFSFKQPGFSPKKGIYLEQPIVKSASLIASFEAQLSKIFPLWSKNDYFIAGGFPTFLFALEHNAVKEDITKFGDIDVYVSALRFAEVEAQFLLKAPGFAKVGPNYNFEIKDKSSILNGKMIQFICCESYSSTYVVDCFDLSICKCFLEKALYFNSRIPGSWFDNNLIIVDQLNPLVEHKCFERLQKYIQRYDIKNVQMSTEIMEKYLEWRGKNYWQPPTKNAPKEIVNEVGKELCHECLVELKWVHMQLKCPSCDKLYAG